MATDMGAHGPADATPVKASEPGVYPTDSSELRNVTVLIADVVGSTRAVLNLEPDAARAYLDRAIEPMLAGVRKYGGAIVASLGDGVVALFGTPSATEDHALRACLAAIEIRDAFAAFPAFEGAPPTRVRIGLHSGGAWTRPKPGGAGAEFDVNGAVVHVASKIEHFCPPGGVAASAATVGLIRGYVRSKSLGPLALDAAEAPVQIELVMEVSPDYQLEHYFAHRRLSPLVGRERERQILSDAVQGTSGLSSIGVIGEAGLGKSRLCLEAKAIAVRAGFRVVEIRGVSLSSATPFAPLRACLAQLLLLGESQPEQELRAQLKEIALSPFETAGVGELLGIPQQDGVWSKMSGDARKKAIVDGVAKTMEAAARRLPLLLIVEDAHDLDHETLACLGRAKDLLASTRCCTIVTARPEGAEPVNALCARTLVLRQLEPADARKLVMNELRGGDVLLQQAPTGLIEGVLERANGNPFVLEELVRGLMSPAARGIGGVPMSVEILIRSRVDKLPTQARRLLQCGSVIGMRFPAMFLRRLAGLSAELFESALRELVRERLVLADAGMSVEFTHQITRLACYEGISHDARRRLHARVLEVAESGEHELMLSYEALADHAYRAAQKDRALDFLWEASRESIAHSAVLSVSELTRRALAICEEVGATADLRAVDFNLIAFDALQQLGAYRELVDPLERALAVSEARQSKRRVCQVSGHLATTLWVLGRYDKAYRFAHRALTTAREANDLPLASYAQFVLGCIQFHRGHVADAARLERELIDQLTGKLETARFGAVAVMSVMSRAFMSWFLTDLGDFEKAEEATSTALRVANAMQQPYSQLLSTAAEGYRLFRMGQLDGACASLEKAYNMCRAGSFLALDATTSGWFASALVRNGRDEDARRIVQRVIEHDLGRYCCVPGSYYTYDAQARLLANAGRPDEALRSIEHGLALMSATRDPLHYAYALFTRAELKANVGHDRPAAARDYSWAMRRAKRLGMRHFEAQCREALDGLA